MKAVVQRVVNASVAVDGETISSIGRGLLVLVGIDRYDEPADATQIIKKILTARLFDDDQGGMWKKNVKDIDGEVLCVSQFTLLAGFKGSKPDFHESMSTIPGKAYYTSFLEEIRKAYDPTKIKDGQFGAMMQVSLCNDGPVTILLSSKDKPKSTPSSSTTPSLAPSRSTTPALPKTKGKKPPKPLAPSDPSADRTHPSLASKTLVEESGPVEELAGLTLEDKGGEAEPPMTGKSSQDGGL
ncbi:D-tyrosyl-tRNA(Tyr) deacylase [Kwoniella shandongensis]|uniref:D-aminoacyl-tRNA deacylase n=1 Tax=Kwoniella shandongensis TaxID=1734106 RepID=A0A5M6C496_9TREE|nr:D-tyrosyl-tRNA(Tyr) deacylase [Kwoniella shandongensis]KAA5529936.1 D-tyrosyl-tRNA(Tyr) deacylase [Kwoniella shandongensis]